jgi:hypothetical protein
MWIEAFGGLLLLVASFLVLRAVIAADAVPAPRARRRRASDPGLRRAA